MEYISFHLFLIAGSLNISAHTHFEQNFKALRISIFVQRERKNQFSVSIGTFLTNYDVTNRKL